MRFGGLAAALPRPLAAAPRPRDEGVMDVCRPRVGLDGFEGADGSRELPGMAHALAGLCCCATGLGHGAGAKARAINDSLACNVVVKRSNLANTECCRFWQATTP